MPNDQHTVNDVNDSPHLHPCLKEFVERVIVPILVKEFLAQSKYAEAQELQLPGRRNCSSKPSASQPEAKSRDLSSKNLLTVVEAAAVLGIKEATVRAWILRRKITYVKLGRVVRIPAKELRLLIERAVVPSC